MKKTAMTIAAATALAALAAGCSPSAADDHVGAAPLVWLADRETGATLHGDCTLRAPWTERSLMISTQHPYGVRTQFTYGDVGCANPVSVELTAREQPAKLLEVWLSWKPDCEAHARVDLPLALDGEVRALLAPTEARCRGML